MKRCPQCEFIYEDDQSLCDMDGALLVFDARTLPNLRALAPIEVPLAPKAVWRHRTFPAMAALILATVLSLVYFVSTQRNTHSPARITGASISEPVPNPAPVESNQAVPAESNPPPLPPTSDVSGAAATAKEENHPASTKAPATAPAAKKPAAVKTQTTEGKRAEEPKKEESKVGSILKKTGRILKKPFKF